MLQQSKAFSTFSVDDKEKAQEFYAKTLGLNVNENSMGHLELNVGGQSVYIYPKKDHLAASFTVFNFVVPKIETVVDDLIEKGVTMERYQGFDHDEKGISRDGGPSIAWFKDPAGNILSVIEE